MSSSAPSLARTETAEKPLTGTSVKVVPEPAVTYQLQVPEVEAALPGP